MRQQIPGPAPDLKDMCLLRNEKGTEVLYILPVVSVFIFPDVPYVCCLFKELEIPCSWNFFIIIHMPAIAKIDSCS